MPRFTAAEYHERFQRIQAMMDQNGFDALLGYSVGNQPGPVAYLSGYELRFGLNDVAYFLYVPGEKPTYALLGNAYWDKIATRTWTDHVFVTSNLVGELKALLPQSAKRIAVAGFNFLPAPTFNALQAEFPNTQFVDATELLKQVAKIKSAAEMGLVREAMRASDAGARTFLDGVKEGVNERALEAEINKAIIAAGGNGLAFPTFLMSGDKVATSIGFSENRQLVAGEQVNLLCGAHVEGYRVELGRITTVGKPSDAHRRIMETTAEMFEAMLGAVKPGVPAGQVAQASLAVAQKNGLDAYLFKPLNNSSAQGHGMGCWVNEPPYLYPQETTLLQENIALSLEARLCLPDGSGAVITEVVGVTPQGAERFSTVPVRTWAA